MELFLQTETWVSLLTLTFMEIVLGIDNIIFISIVANKLPDDKQKTARFIGLTVALLFRICLLLGITWIIGMKTPLFGVLGHEFSGRDIVLLAGGLFLLAKSTSEIHHKMTGLEEHQTTIKKASMGVVVSQIIMLDVIFSFDSILTAVGLTEHVEIMILAVILAMFVMLAFSGAVSRFINKYPTLQVLALSFLILIGFMLVVEALHYHVPKGYIYFSVFFSLVVEFINIKIRRKTIQKKKRFQEKTKAV